MVHVQEASYASHTHLERAFALQDAYQLDSAVKHKKSWGLSLLSEKQDVLPHLLDTTSSHTGQTQSLSKIFCAQAIPAQCRKGNCTRAVASG